MVKINWTDQALFDLVSIADFIRKDSETYARLTVKQLRDYTSRLKTFPNMGRVVPEIGNPDIRELIYGYYRIIYNRRSGKQIDIITIHQSSKLLKP